jgi:prepilin-type N-terminal cleavage/methylation domain-containing protein
MLKKNQKGFSFVELMVVIGIVSLLVLVLVLVALPSYRNFILKAEFIETKMAVSAVKVSLEVCVQTLGLAGAKFCRQSSHGIPGANPAAAGIVGG